MIRSNLLLCVRSAVAAVGGVQGRRPPDALTNLAGAARSFALLRAKCRRWTRLSGVGSGLALLATRMPFESSQSLDVRGGGAPRRNPCGRSSVVRRKVC
jgi:hypothetical protein